MNKIKYEFSKKRPVARFFYQGSHTHPVRRTIIIINQTPSIIVGYEVREGAITRNVKNAPVKSYSKKLIAKVKQIDTRCSLRKRAEGQELNKSTLVRENLSDFIKTGP
jgi:hypothetical protein